MTRIPLILNVLSLLITLSKTDLKRNSSKTHLADVGEYIFSKKCMKDLGCFSNGPPFFSIPERPLSVLPDDRDVIGTKFLLFTSMSPNDPLYFSNDNITDLSIRESDFDNKVKTKFVVPGFLSGNHTLWKQPLKDALLEYEACNVFLVDWSGGDGPFYHQAVANTRVVGAEIALFIENLQKMASLKPEEVHIIGYSLGAHIAGYAGKKIPRLGRITGLDPAGPYFTNVDAVVRLDRGDAIFVDAIHTNGAFTVLTGFGISESIAHFDFFPNGGHLQPGCQDMGHAIMSFLKHPKLDASGFEGLQCNHGRAVELFVSSLKPQQCRVRGLLCESWEKFIAGECGLPCTEDSDERGHCIPLGAKADHYAQYALQDKSLNFYLNTTSTEPFC